MFGKSWRNNFGEGGEINSKNCHYETKNISKTLVKYLKAIIKIVKNLSNKIIELKS